MGTRVPSPGPDAPQSRTPIHAQTIRQALDVDDDRSMYSDDGGWGDEDAHQHVRNQANGHANGYTHHDVPDALRAGGGGTTPAMSGLSDNPWDDLGHDQGKLNLEKVPAVLTPGGKDSTNPFRRKPVPDGAPDQGDQSAISTSAAPPTSTPAGAPSAPAPPIDAFSSMGVSAPEPSSNPWKPVVEQPKASVTPPSVPPLATQDSGDGIWGTAPSRLPSAGPATGAPAALPLSYRSQSPAWDETDAPKPSSSNMPMGSPEGLEFSRDAHAWDDSTPHHGGGNKPAQSGTGGDWNLIDGEIGEPLSTQSSWENFDDPDQPAGPPKDKGKAVSRVPPSPEAPSDLLPSRSTENSAPMLPPRPQSPSAGSKLETYQIKKINWADANAARNPRKSPILVQNANGPCPLVALVNALTLSISADTESVLVETLTSREQISLSLLLQALIEELVSRQTKPDADLPDLPDLEELHAFLQGLHTGMNVNPRFLPSIEFLDTYQRKGEEDTIPGTFEDTRDMQLYATFSIPLIHGWLPSPKESARQAFQRQSSSYDDVQLLLHGEEELEVKLKKGLSDEDQQLYRDIIYIRNFLENSATQLTAWGLEVITKAIRPGTFSILFRNDHFSLLYRHPKTLKLFTLVTDEGYFTHDEIVWESLVDVKGERAEFFSGDFRVVGGDQKQAGGMPGAWHEEGEASTSKAGGSNLNQNGHGAALSHSEQEDADMAYAMQLQDEFEAQVRAEKEARRREAELSEQFIEQQGGREGGSARGRGGGRGNAMAPSRTSSGQVNIPIRGGSNNSGGGRQGRSASQSQNQQQPQAPPRQPTGLRQPAPSRPQQQQQVRPLVPPPGEDEDDAPPSYEQAAKTAPYVPPTGHPNHAESSPSAGSGSSSRRAGGGGRSGLRGRASVPGGGRGWSRPGVLSPGASTSAAGGPEKEDKCVVM